MHSSISASVPAISTSVISILVSIVYCLLSTLLAFILYWNEKIHHADPRFPHKDEDDARTRRTLDDARTNNDEDPTQKTDIVVTGTVRETELSKSKFISLVSNR